MLLKDIAKQLKVFHIKSKHGNIGASNIFLTTSENDDNQNIKGVLQPNIQQLDHPSLVDNAARLYMAPECYDGVSNKTSDIFALGILFYYVLTGGHPFAQTQEKNDDEKTIANIKAKNPPSFDRLRNLSVYHSVQKITLVGLVKRMIAYDPSKRLTVEEVLYHPAFYNDKKKLDFLLLLNIGIQHRLSKIVQDDFINFNKQLGTRDGGWLDDNLDGKFIRFKIDEKKIFEGYDYFFQRDSHHRMWRPVQKIQDIPALLKCLKNKASHACDKNLNPTQFEIDFEVKRDSYNSTKFLTIFLSTCPDLLIHLYELFRHSGYAADFYPT